ncbi:MAG: glutamine--fructose-6-phosphate transaminase (isomerizing) [Clostridia bacterium]
MCGIIGYTSKKNHDAVDIAISCLKNLEYRGYDSSGIALVENKHIKLYKSQGKIENLEKKLKDEKLLSTTALCHTRWATHGEANEINAHPHKVGQITIVHNGIIENYGELKAQLLKQNVHFNTNTDTEVACAYINYIYTIEKDKLKCIQKACHDFKGSFAFGIIFDDEENTIYATRRDSPLIIGIGKCGNFIASDVSAILDYTKEYILLKPLEVAKVTQENIEIYDNQTQLIHKKVNTATWNTTEYKKNGYDHFMLKEIYEQPSVVSAIFDRYMQNVNIYDLDFTKFNNIHIVACGSAMHAGLIGKNLFETYANIPVNVEVASEYRYKNQLITPQTLVIIISQSGETADSLAALRIAKDNKAFTIGIVNAVGSSIAREADKTIYTYAGPEIAVATTKGYTSQVATLSTLVLSAMRQKEILDKNFEMQIYKEFKTIDTTLNDVISKRKEYLKIANTLFDQDNIFFIGRGIDAYICMEGALKLKEISYIHTDAYPAGELKHGTISLIDKGSCVIAISSSSQILMQKTVSNIKEIKARGAIVTFISSDNFGTDTLDFADNLLNLPKMSEFVQPLIVVCALQLIAYETAKLKGADIDKPKNLAKSVTVE